jgi:hypothetical protein
MEPKSVETVNVRVFQEPLEGLIRNCDSDLVRYLDQIQSTNDRNEVFRVQLLLIALRFAVNSYRAVCFLLADIDEHPKRLAEFVIVIPPILRQMIDLWCSVIFLLDDLAARAGEFQNCAWLEVVEHIQKMEERYGRVPQWQEWFDGMDELKLMLEKRVPADLKANTSKIAYWPTPQKMVTRNTKSAEFIGFVHSLIYDITSAEAHLKPGGLLAAGSFLIKDRIPEDVKRQIETRAIHDYKARRFCRVVLVLLGIISEIEMFGKFNNQEQAAKVWSLLAGYDDDATEVYEKRYRKFFAS